MGGIGLNIPAGQIFSGKWVAREGRATGATITQTHKSKYSLVNHVETSRHHTLSMSVFLEFKDEGKVKDIFENRKKVEFDNLDKDKETPESFLNEGDLRKRARPMDMEDILNMEEQAPKIRKKSHKRSQRVLRHLREIVGRRVKGPIDYKKLAEVIKVELSFLDLFQISPDLLRAFKNLQLRVNEVWKNKIKNLAALVHQI